VKTRHSTKDLLPKLRAALEKSLPPKLHAEMLGESAVESLNRNVRQRLARRKPTKAA
jgi:hypothetical protein